MCSSTMNKALIIVSYNLSRSHFNRTISDTSHEPKITHVISTYIYLSLTSASAVLSPVLIIMLSYIWCQMTFLIGYGWEIYFLNLLTFVGTIFWLGGIKENLFLKTEYPILEIFKFLQTHWNQRAIKNGKLMLWLLFFYY